MTNPATRSPSATPGAPPSAGSAHQLLVRAAVAADDGSGGAQVAASEAEGFVVDWQLGPRSGERS